MGFEVQKRVGAAEPKSCSEASFCVVSGARANLTRGGRAGTSIFLSDLVSLAKMALPLRCGVFSRLFRFLFGDPFFANFKWSSSHPLLSVKFVFLFCSPSSWDWGQRRIARVFLGSWPSTFFFGGGFWGLFTKTLFLPLKEGYFGSFLGVSLSFSLASFTSLCHSLSLSFFFLFFSCCLIIFYLLCFLASFLVLFLRFCFMKNNIKILHLQVLFS